MSDSRSAIYDDETEYEDLCRKYGEPIQYEQLPNGRLVPDCYGPHRAQLRALEQSEAKKK